MSRKLTKALREQKKSTQQVPQEIYGTLISINGFVEVKDRPSFVNVQLRDNSNEIVSAFNNKVAASPNLPVLVHREGNRYVIHGVNTQRYQNNWNNYSPYLPKHGTAHSFGDGGGGDVSWIFSRQFMPNLVYPNDGGISGTSAYIAPHVLLTNAGIWTYTGATGTTNLLQYKGTGSSSAMLLIYLDANTGNPGVLVGSGSYFPNTITGTATIYPYIPIPNRATQIPLAAVRMDTGTTHITWDNLYDVRQWIHALPSGTSSGGGGGGIDTIGFAGLANGIPIGTGTILNVQGAGATFTRSGTVFNLDIPGGGGTAPITGSMVIQTNGLTLGSATILNFTNGISASISGTVAQISITGTASYVRTAPPLPLSSITGTYWVTQERIFCSGSLAVFNQGHALIPAIDYLEQYPNSGTFQYLNIPPTGTYHLAIYGIPAPAAGSGGGSGGGILLKSYWDVDAPPTSPTAQDDEFDNGSLDGKWTESDPNSVLTVTESSTYKHLILRATTRAGFNPVGIGQTIPAGDFTIYSFLMFRSPNVDYTVTGLAMWEDITDTTKKIIIYGASPRAAATPFGVFYYTGATTFSAQTLALGSQILPTGLYLRIRRNSTNYFYGFSSDGTSWEENSAAVNPAFTPAQFGVAIDNANTGFTIESSFPFFRYVASDVGLTGILAGQVAGIYK